MNFSVLMDKVAKYENLASSDEGGSSSDYDIRIPSDISTLTTSDSGIFILHSIF